MTQTASWADTADGVLITLVGEIDYSNADEVGAVAHEVFSQRRPAEVRLDLAALPFIDSTGLSALISLYRQALAAGARLVLVDPTPFLLTLLRVTGLLDLFTIESTVADTPEALA